MAADQPGWSWLAPLVERGERIISGNAHGDLPKWRSALESLPAPETFFDGGVPALVLGRPVADRESLTALLMELHPWRKGPLVPGGVHIDTEWRSDWKWDRMADHLDLKGHRVLDVGCGNGYYGWRMLHHGARLVMGIDPTLVFVMQWLACRHFAGGQANFVLPLGVEDLPGVRPANHGGETAGFDTVFSMGVLSHRRDPVAHLRKLLALIKPGGQLLLETLVIEEEGAKTLVPQQRYARMRNVWVVPSLDQLNAWVVDAGFQDTRLLDVSRTSTGEQRSTDWMRFESLADCLDPADTNRTIEGHPAPVRAVLLMDAPVT